MHRSFLRFVGLSLLVATAASADTVHYQTGFEAPEYTIGQLIGQNGWIGDPSSNASVTVQSGTVASGTQAVRIEAFGDVGGSQWVWKPLSTLDASATTLEPIVTVSWDMNLSALSISDTPTKLWGIDLYNNTSRIAVIGVFDEIGGPVVAATGADGFTLYNLGTAPTRSVWHHFDIVLNYDLLSYDVFVDGSMLDSAIPFHIGADAGNDRTLTDGDFTAQGRGSDVGYFDNLSITSSVPEPASLGCMMLASIALLRRR